MASSQKLTSGARRDEGARGEGGGGGGGRRHRGGRGRDHDRASAVVRGAGRACRAAAVEPPAVGVKVAVLGRRRRSAGDGGVVPTRMDRQVLAGHGPPLGAGDRAEASTRAADRTRRRRPGGLPRAEQAPCRR